MSDEKKKHFARLYFRDRDNSFKAALAVFGVDTASALRASEEWPFDEVVLAELDRLGDAGGDEVLPGKCELALLVWKIANATGEPGTAYVSTEDRLKAAKLYGDICGHITKPGTTVNVSNSTDNRVLVMRDHGDEKDWRQAALEQQRRLRINAEDGTRH